MSWWLAVCLTSSLLTSACTGGTSGSTGTVPLTAASTGAKAVATTASSVSPTPVTPDGMATGPGVTDTSITLGLVVDPDTDRGFGSGVRLWQQSVNTSGGICGRTIALAPTEKAESASTTYDRLARTVLGFLALPAAADRAALAAKSGSDGVPVLTVSGSSADLSPHGLVVLGATDDISAINTLSYLKSNDLTGAHPTVGVVSDGSDDALNGLAGARWWAAKNGVSLDVRSGPAPSLSDWGSAQAVLALTDPAQVSKLLAATPHTLVVATTIDGYDPARLTTANTGRLLISLPTPAFGSNHPAAAAVAVAFTTQGLHNPGPLLLAGYALAASWGRLLTQACSDKSLTRTGIDAAMTSVGPASVDSLFGPSDPGLVVKSGLPATRVSSLAIADPKAPAGLKPLIWMQAAPGIANYAPGS